MLEIWGVYDTITRTYAKGTKYVILKEIKKLLEVHSTGKGKAIVVPLSRKGEFEIRLTD